MLTSDAARDLARLSRSGRIKGFLRALVRIEHDAHHGVPLSGRLQGMRRVVVGNRNWRIVYIENDGVALIVAIGNRAEAAVYATAASRVRALDRQHPARALADVLGDLGRGTG